MSRVVSEINTQLILSFYFSVTTYPNNATAFDKINLKLILHELCRFRVDRGFPNCFLCPIWQKRCRGWQFLLQRHNSFQCILVGHKLKVLFFFFIFFDYINDLHSFWMQFFNAGVTITVGYLCNSEELKQDTEKPFFWSTEKKIELQPQKLQINFFSRRKRSQIQASLPGTKRYITRKSLQRYIKIVLGKFFMGFKSWCSICKKK